MLEVMGGHQDLAFALLAQLMRLNNMGPSLPRKPVERVDETIEPYCDHAYCAGGFVSKNGVEG